MGGWFFRVRPQGLTSYLRGLGGTHYTSIASNLNGLYGGDGCCHVVLAALDDTSELMRIAERLTKDIYDAKQMPDKIPDDLLQGYAQQLLGAINTGFKTGDEVSDLTARAIVKALKQNVYQFSAAKSYVQLKALTEALLDENGKLRTFNQFRAAAYQINDTHVNQWLVAEYNNAVCASDMAGKWAGIQATKAILPYLEFDAVIDSHTTELCRTLNGTKLPADHPFWNTYYPPNHYGERATVRQLRYAVVTPANEIPSAEIPKIFQANLAKENMVFPPNHPYFVEAPASVIQQGNTAFVHHVKPQP